MNHSKLVRLHIYTGSSELSQLADTIIAKILCTHPFTVNVLIFQTIFPFCSQRIHKMYVRIANREYPDQTASSGSVSALFA